MSPFKKRERTELDNEVLPPLLQDEVRVFKSSVSSGRDSYVASKVTKVTNWFNSYKEVILGIALGLVLVEGAMLYFEYRHKAQQNELARANFSDWQAFNFNPWVAKVEADHELIQAYGLNKTIAENCKR